LRIFGKVFCNSFDNRIILYLHFKKRLLEGLLKDMKMDTVRELILQAHMEGQHSVDGCDPSCYEAEVHYSSLVKEGKIIDPGKTGEGCSEETAFMDEARAAVRYQAKQAGLPELPRVKEKTFAALVAYWMDTAAQNERNTDYYRGLLEKIGKRLGKPAFIADDGTVMQDVICAKVPDIVDDLLEDSTPGEEK